MRRLISSFTSSYQLANLPLYVSYKPAPFFVLDEIDAALDNTNIGKVGGVQSMVQM